MYGKLIDSVFNMTFLTKKSNQFIKDKATKEYFKELADVLNINEESMKSIFSDHFINDSAFDAFIEERFEDFLKIRAEEIKNYLKIKVGLDIDDIDVKFVDSVTDEDLEEDSED
ncbi:MAG: hypothetical protein LBE35_04235 [Clostridiales bacterium]|jgi:hypothetical protein|nr:hypothetical protein [Clostridiales bacterium]